MYTLLVSGYDGTAIFSAVFDSVDNAIDAGEHIYHGIYDFEVFDASDLIVYKGYGIHPYAART